MFYEKMSASVHFERSKLQLKVLRHDEVTPSYPFRQCFSALAIRLLLFSWPLSCPPPGKGWHAYIVGGESLDGNLVPLSGG